MKMNIKDKRYSLAQLLLVSIILCGLDLNVNSYFIYIVLILYAIFFYKRLSLTSQPGLVTATIIIVFISLFRVGQYSEYLFTDCFLMVLGFLPMIFNAKFDVKISVLNLICVVCLLVSQWDNLSDFNLSTDSIINSDIGTEANILPFILPLFAIRNLERKEYKMFIVNVIMTVIAGKRISFLGLVIACLAYLFLQMGKNKKYDLILKLSIVIVVVLYLSITQMLVLGVFDDYIFQKTGLSANAFTMGRLNRYSLIVNDQNVNYLFGIGIGNTCSYYELESFNRIHNDIYKLFVENGVLLFILYWWIVLRKTSGKSLIYLVYLTVLFMTDNVLVYAPFMFAFGYFAFKDVKNSIINKQISCI